jgi:transcriptional regulator with XRE-family HTH domain
MGVEPTQGEWTLSKRIAGQIDAYVGRRIRLGRTFLGMTQDHLATLLGVTYQQLQKYENGVNRISAGRLSQVAKILGVPVDFFYEDVTRSQSESAEQLHPRVVQFLGTEEGVQLGKAFIRIKAPQIRRRLLDLVRLLAKDIDDSL